MSLVVFQAQAEALKRQLKEEIHERTVLNAKMQADMKVAEDFTSDTDVKQVKVSQSFNSSELHHCNGFT